MNSNQLALAPLAVLLLLAGCPDDEEEPRTRNEFCEAWGEAACTEDAVSACQAKDTDACEQTQEEFCRTLVPADDFSDARGDECLEAVSDAYADANLDNDELATVLQLGAPCDQLISGPKEEGESCTTRRDCDAPAGFDCVIKSDAAKGTCQIPEEVGGGRDCEALKKTCEAGFYCDGENCIEGRDSGEDCTVDAECAVGTFCGLDATCTDQLDVDDACTEDAQCLSGLCYDFDGDRVCTNRIVLSRSEPICEDLR